LFTDQLKPNPIYMLKMYSFGELAAFVQSTAITAVGQRLF